VDTLPSQPAPVAPRSPGGATIAGGQSGSGDGAEWRRLTDALLRPATDASLDDALHDEEESLAWEEDFPGEASVQPANVRSLAASVSARFAAARRLATAMGLAALLLVGILLLHLIV
ncbi:MAG: hypothetical protein ACRDHP_06895, partial [Ktedonobacterales bacterium]